MSVEDLPKNIAWEAISVGQEVFFEREVTKEQLQAFISLTGDKNPLHQDVDFARGLGFDREVVPGLLLASFFSTLVGSYLPGLHNLYISQNVQFKKAVLVGEKIRVVGKVTEKVESVRLLTLETKILNSTNEVVVQGEATVKYI